MLRKKNNFHALKIFTFSALLGLCYCKSTDSQKKHTLGELTWDDQPFQWASVDREFILKELRESSRSTVRTLGVDDRVYQGVKQIIDQLDSAARKKYGHLLKNTPKPEPLVVADGNATAMSLASSVCVDVNFVKEGENSFGGPLRIDAMGNALNEVIGSICPKKAMAPEDLKDVIQLYNTNASPACQISYQGSGLIMGKKCDAEGILNAKQIVFQASSPFIQVNTGLIVLLEKAELESVIAHELAHYYRAHSLWGDSNRYGFFYLRGHHKLGQRPLPDKTGEAEYQVFKLQNYANTRLIEKQNGGEIFPGLVGIFLQDQNMRSFFEKGRQCEAFVQSGESSKADGLNEIIFSGGKLKGPRLEAFKLFSSRISRCLKANSPYSESWKLKLSEAIAVVFESRVAPFDPVDYLTLIDKLQKSYDDRLEKRAEAFEAARKTGLSWYTAEQEADELSLELLQLAGKNPASAYGALFKIMDHKKDPDLNGITNDQCRKLLASDWKIDATLVKLFYGDLNDPHHSLCYRVWNVYQEIADHGYKGPYASAVESNWDEVRALARQHSQSFNLNSVVPRKALRQLACAFGDIPRLGVGRN